MLKTSAFLLSLCLMTYAALSAANTYTEADTYLDSDRDNTRESVITDGEDVNTSREEQNENSGQIAAEVREPYFEGDDAWDTPLEDEIDAYAYDASREQSEENDDDSETDGPLEVPKLRESDSPDMTLSSPELPGKDIKYKLKLYQVNYHDLHGRADSEIGKLRFKAKLMPSNEVKLDVKIKGEDELLFKAYFDLANFTMELDGGGAVLSSEQKTMMNYTAQHLRHRFLEKFENEVPHHNLLTVQMLTYWSKSPEGYSHTKREIESKL